MIDRIDWNDLEKSENILISYFVVSIIRSFSGENISQAWLKHRILGNYTTHRNHDSRKSEFLQYKTNQAWLKHNFLLNSCNLQNFDNRQEIEGVSFC